MITLIEQFLSLFEECASQYNDSCGTISNFIVLTLGELDQQSCNWVLDFHLLDDSSTIIGDGDFLIR